MLISVSQRTSEGAKTASSVAKVTLNSTTLAGTSHTVRGEAYVLVLEKQSFQTGEQPPFPSVLNRFS